MGEFLRVRSRLTSFWIISIGFSAVILLGTLSLTGYAAEPITKLTIMFLIIVGGIGFLTWDDIRTNRLRLSKYRMQSKVILCTTALLLAVPAVYFYFFEFAGLASGFTLCFYAPDYLVTFTVMFMVALFNGSLATRLKDNVNQSARAHKIPAFAKNSYCKSNL